MTEDHVRNCINQAKILKEEGTVAFKSGHYKKAWNKYALILTYVTGFRSPSDIPMMGARKPSHISQDLLDEAGELEIISYANAAECLLRLEEYEKCVVTSTKALNLSNNPKVLFRRAKAYYYLKNISAAMDDINILLKLQPNPSSAVLELKDHLEKAFINSEKNLAKKLQTALSSN